ncbi:heavy metal-associated isoprenylated plant protein 27-like protein [Cinnamomum micranthum f. kanehirae]|uniref:Heavy metal-associated isoprenylated plant protein 27-like protein n=1 Tax=Cinnamomum micranthum f. kanehirae TaxID=337451 RepID=A0A3S3NEG0_9MAGN|nr:heavy metal-associated isoprenylated plant protein 27-like protein [Cinnamomum micranthum f. kanehirae]
MGALDYVSGIFDFSSSRRRSKKKFKNRKQLQTVEIRVRMDCEGCEQKVRRAVEGMKDVVQVEVDGKQWKLTVVGYMDPNKVLKRVSWRTGKKAELWPYVPYDTVAHPYAPGAYDKKAPPGYVRNVMDPGAASIVRASSREERYTNTFSDDNPNACSVIKKGEMGALDYVSGIFDFSSSSSKKKFKKRKQLQTVEIRVRMDCEGCERKVRKAVEGMKDVVQVEVDRKQWKLTVVGYMDPNKVLKRVRWRTGKKAELWPYVPYNMVAHPYAPGAYDKKAPPGYVRNVMDPEAASIVRASSTEERYTNAFSDDNPNACSVIFIKEQWQEEADQEKKAIVG